MKAISVLNLFTVACFVMVGFGAEVSWATDYKNKEDCVAAKTIELKKTNGCANKKKLDKDGKPTTEADSTEIASCNRNAADDAALDPICAALPSASEISASKSECTSLISAYRSSMLKAQEQCSRIDYSNIPGASDGVNGKTCQEVAQACAAGKQPSDIVNGTSTGNSIADLFVTAYQMGQSGSSTSADGCTIQDDEAGRNAESSRRDKIARLKEKQIEDKQKKVDEDRKVAEKKAKMNEDILKAQQELNKQKKENMTETAKANYDAAKAKIDNAKKKRDNLTAIDKATTDISNLSFAAQELNLTFATTNIAKTCRDAVEKMKKDRLGVDPKTGKSSQTLTAPQKGQLAKDLTNEQNNCLSAQALSRNAKFKALNDQRNDLEKKIKDLQASNGDIDNAQAAADKNLADNAANMAASEKQDAADLQTKISNLTTSLAEFQASVDEKKKNIDDGIAEREKLIAEIGNEAADVKPKFGTVNQAISAGSSAANSFADRCCSGDKTVQDSNTALACKQVKTDFPDAGKSTTGGLSIPGTNF